MPFEKELKKLGLKDKEAAVYLAALALGSSPVQQISRKAKVVRATTYVVLDSLMDMGLVTKYKEGKKTLFSAEPPRQLIRLLEKQRETIDEQQYELELLLPELQILMKSADSRPSVRYFSGLEGLKVIRTEMVMHSHPGDIWYNFTPMDHLQAVFGREESFFTRQRLAKNIHGKTIFTTRSEKLKQELLHSADQKSERRFVKPEYFPSKSGLTLFRDRIAIGSFTGEAGGVIVDSPDMAEMMRNLFMLAWEGAEQANGTNLS